MKTQISSRRLTAREGFALGFGLLLGLALVKFGNPVVLNSKISPPASLPELWWYAWPPSWSIWFLAPLALLGSALAIVKRRPWPGPYALLILPAIWFVWQLISALHTVDRELTVTTVVHFAGLFGCYLLGAFVVGHDRSFRFLLVGSLAAFAFCLVRAVDQRLFEFPQERQFLLESQRAGWTNVPPAMLLDMKEQGVVLTTNGVDIANPIILEKYRKGRVFGTLVYPNALAGAVLLFFPLSVALAVTSTRFFRKLTRLAVIGLTFFLGLAALFWTGSKSGWLIALAVAGACLFRLRWPLRAKWVTFVLVLALGLGFFGFRFRNYFAAGATSVGARFDYWRAAAQTFFHHPLFGTGPGTFQRPYSELKHPQAEMARLTHNDYLEQFSDSGLVGGLAYAGWILASLSALGRRLWTSHEPLYLAAFLGLSGWLLQGLSEFSLYVPALAWTAFTLAGCLLSLTGNQPALPSGASAPALARGANSAGKAVRP